MIFRWLAVIICLVLWIAAVVFSTIFFRDKAELKSSRHELEVKALQLQLFPTWCSQVRDVKRHINYSIPYRAAKGAAKVWQTIPKWPIPERWKNYADSWVQPRLERHIVDDMEMQNMAQSIMPDDIFEPWMKFNRSIEKADFFRYAVLYAHGGIYADMDMELKDADVALALAQSGVVMLALDKRIEIGQALMISPPRHPFLLGLMRYIVKSYDPDCYEIFTTGPRAISDFFYSSGGCNTWPQQGVVVVTDAIGDQGRSDFTKHHMTGVWRTKRRYKQCSRNVSYDSLCSCVDTLANALANILKLRQDESPP